MNRTHSIFTTEGDPSVAELRQRMDAFYATTDSYPAFHSVAIKGDEWPHVADAIRDKLKVAARCRVLEFGAGRTGFGDFLGELRAAVDLTIQDVTPSNAEFLRTQADHVHIGPVSEIAGKFDLIFSTYVLEHVSDPRATLEHLFSLLNPGGVLLIFCPRYDFPLYLSHSADHYESLKRFIVAVGLLARRAWTFVSGQPAFLIHRDPSVFHMPFVIDRDAIHWVSLFDLKAFFRGRGQLRTLKIECRGSRKQWFVKRFLTVNVAITKLGS